jgi:ABC-2 type transport system ATP-binding protein
MEQMVEAQGLCKQYGTRRRGIVRALDGLTLSAPTGGVLAILGPNGAGKTTFVRTVATLTRPDAGTLRVAGVDALRHPERVRTLIGLAGQSAAVEEAMTGRENLEMVARLFGQSAADARRNARATLERLDLADAGDRLVRGWSGGMRRRLDLGASLVGRPRILLLDEPTTGLDPASRIALWEAVRDLVAGGTDVLLTTQYLDEADHLADQVVIVDHGRTIAHGTPAELKRQAGRSVIEVHVRDRSDIGDVAQVLTAIGDGEVQADESTRRVTVVVEGGTEQLSHALIPLEQLKIALDDVALRPPRLDEVFLTLTVQAQDGERAGGDEPAMSTTPTGDSTPWEDS